MKEVELNLIICTLFNPIDSKYYFDMEAYEKLRDTYFTFFFFNSESSKSGVYFIHSWTYLDKSHFKASVAARGW